MFSSFLEPIWHGHFLLVRGARLVVGKTQSQLLSGSRWTKGRCHGGSAVGSALPGDRC